jgi:hypothetical protein
MSTIENAKPGDSLAPNTSVIHEEDRPLSQGDKMNGRSESQTTTDFKGMRDRYNESLLRSFN